MRRRKSRRDPGEARATAYSHLLAYGLSLVRVLESHLEWNRVSSAAATGERVAESSITFCLRGQGGTSCLLLHDCEIGSFAGWRLLPCG